MAKSQPVAAAAAIAAIRGQLSGFLSAPKAFAAVTQWDRDGATLRFDRAIDIDGVTEEGLYFFGRARLSVPDRDVTIGIRWHDPRNNGGCFERIDWRPIHSHNNKNIGPEAHRLTLQEDTHTHRLEENASLPYGIIKAMKLNLPIAIPVDPDPRDWASFMGMCSSAWNAPGFASVAMPAWQLGLIPPSGDERVPRMKGRGK